MKNNERLSIYKKENKTFYQMNFSSLSDLHTYFLSDPLINKDVFHNPASEKNSFNFAGVPFEETLKYLVNSYSEGYEEYLELKKQLPNDFFFSEKRREVIKSVQGSRPNVPNFVAGSPKSMYRLQRQNEYNFITVHFNLSYPSSSNRHKITNRGILTLNLIKLLEANGYKVKLNTFVLCDNCDEAIYISIPLKKANEKLNERKTYFPFCSREFFRRDLFRVMETMPVEKRSWGSYYGRPVHTYEMKEYLDIFDTDIIIGTPHDMGIIGDFIEADAESFLDEIKIEKYIDPKQLKLKR